MYLLEMAKAAGKLLSQACQDSPVGCPVASAQVFQESSSPSLRPGCAFGLLRWLEEPLRGYDRPGGLLARRQGGWPRRQDPGNPHKSDGDP
jgi:hypothetical protein